MDKLQYGNFDSSLSDITFDSNKGYTEPSGESEVRKQLSYPLKEIKDYINNTIPVKVSNNDVIQLGLTSQRTLQYRDSENGKWRDTASSGHTIFIKEGDTVEQMPQRSEIQFNSVTASDTGTRTIIQGLTGPQGEQGPQGIQGIQGIQGVQGYSFLLSGAFPTYEDLIETVTSPSIGDAYAIGTDPYDTYVYGETLDGYGWTNLGRLTIGPQGVQGPQGIQGEQGPRGLKGDTGEGVPTGGLTGQFLKKASGGDYDVTWAPIPSYMEFVQNAVDDDILVVNASGQAVDSGVQIDDLKVLEIVVPTISSLPTTFADSSITEKHTLLRSELSNPAAQKDDWTVTTSNGIVTINGTVEEDASTDLTLILAVKV